MQIVKRGTKGKSFFFRKERRRRPTSQVDIFNIILAEHSTFSVLLMIRCEP